MEMQISLESDKNNGYLT